METPEIRRNRTPSESKETPYYSTKGKATAFIKRKIPILEWLPLYKWRTDFVNDLFSGMTLALINVPQALAFAFLANAPPISGIYTACFTALVYSCLGTARVSSFGPVAVGSMFTGEAVAGYMASRNMSITPDGTPEDHELRVTFIATMTFTIGLIYMSFYLLQLSVVRVLFTKAFITGLISGLATQVLVKTLKMVLGIHVPSHYGFFVVLRNLRDLFIKLPDTHYPTFIFSLVVFTILLLNTFVFKKLVAKVTKFVVPIEAILLICSVTISYLFEFHKLGFETLGHIPRGLPELSPVEPSLLIPVLPDAIATACINYATALSMIIAFNPDVIDANQETLAMATSNLICSNIQCITIGNSIIRTVVVINLGTKSLLTTIISSIILFMVVLYAGPLLQPLPTAILGCIIIMSIGQLLVKNMQDVQGIVKTSLEDGIILVIAFLVTTFLDMQLGLISGFVLTLRQLLVRVISDDQEKELEEEQLRAAEASKLENDKLLERGRKLSIADQ